MLSLEDEDDQWWQTPNGHSKVKIEIVSKYFESWAAIIGRRSEKMHYIDLYAGRGAYADGHASTPINILNFAVQDSECRSKLQAMLNDKSEKSAAILRQNIAAIPNIQSLTFAPRVYSTPIDKDFTTRAEQVENLGSSFIFVDPFGGKGVSLALLKALLKHEKTDGFLFFNYNRTNMWLQNPLVEHIVRGLFGDVRYESLRAHVEGLDETAVDERERVMIDAFQNALLEEISARSVPFKLVTQDEKKIYYLFGISKNRTAFKIMKDVMGKQSTAHSQGVPTFEWNPIEHDDKRLFFEMMEKPLDELVGRLPVELAGCSLTPEEMIWEHGQRNRYTHKNYFDACVLLFERNQVDASQLGQKKQLTQKSTVIFPKVPR